MSSCAFYFPISGQSKRQECVSHSTTEAEIVAADWALRREGIPALDLWDILSGAGQQAVFHEDNESMIKVCRTGKNPTMRHLLRSHGVAIAWLKEQFDSGRYVLQHVSTIHQAADIYTTNFDNPAKLKSAWPINTSNCAEIPTACGNVYLVFSYRSDHFRLRAV